MEAATVPQSAFDGSVFQIPQPIKFSLTWLYIANTALQTLHKKKKRKWLILKQSTGKGHNCFHFL